ncbi:hypothetical protein ACFSWE_03400 [Leucobacter albus]|uniref:N-acetyltransferase domain-containing protein n=1 Tax=Leucobacter albus TaxID=272210 RepID=A0ABW3TPE3_9MICO
MTANESSEQLIEPPAEQHIEQHIEQQPQRLTERPLAERVSAPASLPLPTVGADLTWRRLRRDDLPALLELDTLCGVEDHPRLVNTLDMFEEGFDAPSFDPELDSAVALDGAGTLVAYGEAVKDSEAATIVKVHLNGQVRPDRRREGIGTALLAWQEGRGLQHLAASDLHLPLAHGRLGVWRAPAARAA